MQYVLLIVLLLLNSVVIADNEVCFTIEDIPSSNDVSLNIFYKYINVLDCIHVYAVSSISDEKILHAAAVVAELLDNNEDGIVDDLLLEQKFNSSFTVMPIFQSENSSLIDEFFSSFDGCTGAILFNSEIDFSQTGHWGEDATVEEVLHTINACGHVEIYPSIFSLAPSSSYLSDAMDIARGGQFISFPSSYPDEAWYH